MKTVKPFATIKSANVERTIKGLLNKIPTIHEMLEKKINAIVTVVYNTARIKRPKITHEEQKALHRASKGYRVSDPDATVGVPVDTGALQESIKKEVHWEGDIIKGTISAGEGIPYAYAIEYGNSRITKRPFMRPAYNENLEWIKRKFQEKSTK